MSMEPCQDAWSTFYFFFLREGEREIKKRRREKGKYHVYLTCLWVSQLPLDLLIPLPAISALAGTCQKGKGMYQLLPEEITSTSSCLWHTYHSPHVPLTPTPFKPTNNSLSFTCHSFTCHCAQDHSGLSGSHPEAHGSIHFLNTIHFLSHKASEADGELVLAMVEPNKIGL